MSRRQGGIGGVVVRTAFGLIGAAFLLVVFFQTWDRSRDVLVLPWWRPAVAVVLSALGLLCALGAWRTLLGPKGRRGLAWGFYVSQLGKYVPGGIWQPAGQIGYAAQTTGSLADAGTSFAVFAVTQTVAGAVLGATLALVHPDLAPVHRIGLLGGASLLLLLDRRWMVRALGLLGRARVLRGEPTVPGQGEILAACLWSVGTLVASGLAYAILLAGLGGSPFPVVAVPALALAWVVGFLVLPVPSGIGVREGVLVVALAPVAPVAGVIAASVYHRLTTILAEVAMIGAARIWPSRIHEDGPPAGGSRREGAPPGS
jgi:glycosyltransferase 2 family protein